MFVTDVSNKNQKQIWTQDFSKVVTNTILQWQHNQLSYGMFSINLLLYFDVCHTIFAPKVTEGQVTYPYYLPHPPGYGGTSYISILSAPPTWQVIYPYCWPHPLGYGRTCNISLLSAPSKWLWKDKGQVTCSPTHSPSSRPINPPTHSLPIPLPLPLLNPQTIPYPSLLPPPIS